MTLLFFMCVFVAKFIKVRPGRGGKQGVANALKSPRASLGFISSTPQTPAKAPL